MKLEDALSFALDTAKQQGAQAADVWVGENTSEGLEVFEQKVKNVELSTSRGLGIRVFHGERPGYAFTEKLSIESIKQTVSDALSHTQLTAPLPLELPAKLNLEPINLNLEHPVLLNIDLDTMKNHGFEMEAQARQAHQSVENVPYTALGKSKSQALFGNHQGVFAQKKANDFYAGLGVVAHAEGIKKMGYYSNQITNLAQFSPSLYAHRAVARAVEMLGPKPVPSGKYPIILSNRVSPAFFSMYSSAFFAEAAQKGQSRLAGKTGQILASTLLTLSCEPHLPNHPGSRLFDGEGVATQALKVIHEGRLETLLYNLESASREKRSSTGHASRGYSGQVGTSFSNLVVPLDSKNLTQLKSSHNRCLYITSLEGSSGCSAVSGELSIGAQGFLIENGEMVHPVDRITLSGNFFELIQKIEGIGDAYSDQMSSVRVPDILISSIDVAS